MQSQWIIIDGYSLLHRHEALQAIRRAGLEVARQRVVRDIEEIADALADRITIVFDGRERGAGEGYESAGVEVLFSPGHMTADTLIERAVHDAPEPGTILVVTSDRAEAETVSASGAQTTSCDAFLARMKDLRERSVRRARTQKQAPKTTLGEFFPDGNAN